MAAESIASYLTRKRGTVLDGEQKADITSIISRHCPTAALHEALVAQEEACRLMEGWAAYCSDPNRNEDEYEGRELAVFDAVNIAKDLRKAALAPTTEA